MPAAVKDAIKFAVEKCGGQNSQAATEFVDAMERDGRLIEECWS
jgi:Sulfite reductase, alpha subunit (flavoprotein)